MGETLALAAAESAGPIPMSLYGVVVTVDFLFLKGGLIFLNWTFHYKIIVVDLSL